MSKVGNPIANGSVYVYPVQPIYVVRNLSCLQTQVVTSIVLDQFMIHFASIRPPGMVTWKIGMMKRKIKRKRIFRNSNFEKTF